MQRERSYFFPLKVMGRVLQNYSRGKQWYSFTGKSNHPKQGAGDGKNSATKEKMSLWRAGEKKGAEGRTMGMVGQRRNGVSDPFLSDATSHSDIVYLL